jgi:hypothetical protein
LGSVLAVSRAAGISASLRRKSSVTTLLQKTRTR